MSSFSQPRSDALSVDADAHKLPAIISPGTKPYLGGTTHTHTVGHPDGVCGIVPRPRVRRSRNRGSIPDEHKGFFSSPQRPDGTSYRTTSGTDGLGCMMATCLPLVPNLWLAGSILPLNAYAFITWTETTVVKWSTVCNQFSLYKHDELCRKDW